MPLPTRTRRRVLTGSALQLGADEKRKGYSGRKALDWQNRALRIVDLIPELDYASRFYSRMLSPVRLYPATRDENGELKEIMSGPPVDHLNRIQDPGGGRAQIQAAYGRLSFITGEGNLFGYDLETEDETWIYIWNDELKVERSGDEITKITWTPTDTQKAREFGPDEAVVYKFWTPHPRRSGEATSPLRAIVEGGIAEELIALTKSVAATALARSTRGILVMPLEIEPPVSGTEGDEDPEVSPWLTEIAEHMEAQIERAGDPATVAPYLMQVAYEFADRIRLLETHNPQHDYLERELRKEAIERIAMGVDFPREALTGIGSTNHWAALQILMDMWRSHGAPKARELCDDLNSAYLRPALREDEYEGWENVIIAADAAEVTVKPDRSDDARIGLQLGALGPFGFRELLDIPHEYALKEEEIELLRKLKSAGRQPQPERSPEQGPEQPGPEGDSGRRTRVTSAAALPREPGVLELALMRCRELAGIRIGQRAKRQAPDLATSIEAVPYSSIAASLGPDVLKRLGLSNHLGLVSGGADNLRSLLRACGYTDEQAELFGEIVEVHAAKTLFEEEFPEVPMQIAALSRLEAA